MRDNSKKRKRNFKRKKKTKRKEKKKKKENKKKKLRNPNLAESRPESEQGPPGPLRG